jgi:hypothetical protein
MTTHAELVQKAFDQKKLRYPPSELNLNKTQTLELNRTGFSGVEFGWDHRTRGITWATQTIDGEDLEVTDFIEELAKAVGEDPLDFLLQDDLHTDHLDNEQPCQHYAEKPLKQFIVTQKTSIMARSEDDAIEAVNNMEKGDRYPEIIEQTADRAVGDATERFAERIATADLERVVFYALALATNHRATHIWPEDPNNAASLELAEENLAHAIFKAAR